MGENTYVSDPSKDDNASSNDEMAIENQEDPELDMTEQELCEDELEDEQEYNTLNKQLDDLNSALDVLEEKNDNITTQLLELLQNSREVRQLFANERTQGQPSS